ncbi:helix-turn-helix domain-containing protein [Deinococcus marmoris]|uniref:helix-turn-helix domain-containing protein n=1 Tax=Deinococcus marmoris TaxID=249408 RepID=UPI0012DEC992|nr:helix-turn-helix transcriptional regulator [Deinococcus marmoris]
MNPHDRFVLNFATPEFVGTAVVSPIVMEEQLGRLLPDQGAEHLKTMSVQLLAGRVVVSGQTVLWTHRLTPDLLGGGETNLPLERPPLAQLLDDADLSNGQVAAALDTTTVTVSRWRARRVVPPVTSAIRLATFIGVPVETIEWRPDEDRDYEMALNPFPLVKSGQRVQEERRLHKSKMLD